MDTSNDTSVTKFLDSAANDTSVTKFMSATNDTSITKFLNYISGFVHGKKSCFFAAVPDEETTWQLYVKRVDNDAKTVTARFRGAPSGEYIVLLFSVQEAQVTHQIPTTS